MLEGRIVFRVLMVEFQLARILYELVRLKRRGLHLFGHSPGRDWGILIGADKRHGMALRSKSTKRNRSAVWHESSTFGIIQ